MSFYNYYLQKLVGGSVRSHKNKIKQGQIVSFLYGSTGSKRKLPRIVFVLNRRNMGHGMKVHGLNLEWIPYQDLARFLKRVLITDTVSLIKRRYELQGPFNELMDRPKGFYASHIKPTLSKHRCYRTYDIAKMKDVKIWMLDWKKILAIKTAESSKLLIAKSDNLDDIKRESAIINEVVSLNNIKLKDKKFEKLIKERFGTVDDFLLAAADSKNFAITYDRGTGTRIIQTETGPTIEIRPGESYG